MLPLVVVVFAIIFIVFIILVFYALNRYAKRDKEVYGKFLKRLIPGIFGGLFVWILTQLKEIWTSTNLIEILVPSLIIIAVALLVIFLSYILYYRIEKT